MQVRHGMTGFRGLCILLLVVAAMVCLLVFLSPRAGGGGRGEGADPAGSSPVPVSPRIDYYAYGDSITRASGDRDLNDDGSDAFILQMRGLYAPGAIAIHNMDGGGRTSEWGIDALPSHYTDNTEYFVYMFTNDGWVGYQDQVTVKNYLAIYDYVLHNGTIPVPLIPILTSRPSSPEYSLESQQRRIQLLEAALDREAIYYVRMYDALDSKPFNNRMDSINTTLMPDGIHPDRTGHRMMAVYLGEKLALLPDPRVTPPAPAGVTRSAGGSITGPLPCWWPG